MKKIKKFLYFIFSLLILFLIISLFFYYKGYKKGYEEAKREIIVKTDTLKIYSRDTIFQIKEIQIKIEKKDTDTIFLERKIFLPQHLPFYLIKKEPLQIIDKEKKYSFSVLFLFSKNSYIPSFNININKYNFFYGYDLIKREHKIGIGLTLIKF